jgi:hypothetical protein
MRCNNGIIDANTKLHFTFLQAIVFALQQLNNVSREEAEQLFFK